MHSEPHKSTCARPLVLYQTNRSFWKSLRCYLHTMVSVPLEQPLYPGPPSLIKMQMDFPIDLATKERHCICEASSPPLEPVANPKSPACVLAQSNPNPTKTLEIVVR